MTKKKSKEEFPEREITEEQFNEASKTVMEYATHEMMKTNSLSQNYVFRLDNEDCSRFVMNIRLELISPITYLKGDATHPIGEGKKVIVHVCNNIGVWGAGFVLALSARWKEPEEVYKKHKRYGLGEVHLAPVGNDIVVANMIAQDGVGSTSKTKGRYVPPIRYDAVEEALKKVNMYCEWNNASIHAPRFGCGLAGGKWEKIEEIITRVVTVPVYIYDLP